MTSDGYDVYHQTTEWEDALAKHKIIEKKKKPIKNDIIDTKHMWEEKEKDPYADKSLAELDELEDEIDEDVCFISIFMYNFVFHITSFNICLYIFHCDFAGRNPSEFSI